MNRFLVGIFLSQIVFITGETTQTIQSADIIISAFNNNSVIEHLTPHLLEIARNGHSLPEEIKLQLQALGFDFSQRLVLYTRPELDHTYDSGVFRFHYNISGDSAVNSLDTAGAPGVPDYIDQIAESFNTVYNEMIDNMGYYRPPSDGWYPSGNDNGGSDHYDVYIYQLTYGWYGFVAAEEYADNNSGDNENSTVQEHNAVTSYMALRNNYDGFPKSELESIQVTAAHEFFHSIQYGYDWLEKPWLMEATAVWMEDAVYDDINDCYQYMRLWFNSPETSLDYYNEYGSHHYGSFIFFQYIDEHLGGRSTIRRIWESSITHISSESVDYSHLAINDGLIPENSSFKDALNKMAIANRIMSSDISAGNYSYDEADDYPVFGSGPSTFQTLNYIAGNPDSLTSMNLQKFASQYIRIVATKPVKVELTNLSGPQTDLQLHAILKSIDEDYIVISGSPINIDPNLGFSWMYLTVVSQEAKGDNWDYQLVFTDGAPTDFKITNPYPNPFIISASQYNNYTQFDLTVGQSQRIKITIYDITGRTSIVLLDGFLSARPSPYKIIWSGRTKSGKKAASGIYFIVIEGEQHQRWKRITLIK